MESKAYQPSKTSKNLPSRLRNSLTIGIALSLLAATSLAQSNTGKSNRTRETQTSPKKKTASKVTHQRSPSEETTAEHDRRMFRECRGLHNAGACRGYTRK